MCAAVDVAEAPGPRVAHVDRAGSRDAQLGHQTGVVVVPRPRGRRRHLAPTATASSPTLRQRCGDADRDQPVVARRRAEGRLAASARPPSPVEDVDALLVGVHVRRHERRRARARRSRSRCAPPACPPRPPTTPGSPTAPTPSPSAPVDQRARPAGRTRWSVAHAACLCGASPRRRPGGRVEACDLGRAPWRRRRASLPSRLRNSPPTSTVSTLDTSARQHDRGDRVDDRGHVERGGVDDRRRRPACPGSASRCGPPRRRRRRR